MTNATKSETLTETFTDEVADIITDYVHTEENGSLGIEYVVDTELGGYRVKHTDYFNGEYSILGRFDSPEESQGAWGSNPYTGKMNIHEQTAVKAQRELVGFLERFAYPID